MSKHHFMRSKLSLLVAAVVAAGVAPAAFADSTNDQLQQMQQQIQQLEQRLQDLQTQTTEVKSQNQDMAGKIQSYTAQSGAMPTTYENQSGFKMHGVTVTFGGFLAEENVFRSSNLESDINTPYAHIGFNPNPNGVVLTPGQQLVDQGSYYNQSEFRMTARQSRFAVMAQGNIDPNTVVTGYYETDWLGGSPTANSNESNSYTMRVRHLYSNIDWLDSGWHLLAGQSWSLATLNTQGITPRNEEIPLTIDAAYYPGFVWARQAQIRVVKDWDKKFWAALSIENAQTSGVGGTFTPGTGNIYSLPAVGGGLLTPAAFGNYSVNRYPDIIGKLAAETDYGHYEVFGMLRNFQSTYNGAGVAGANQSDWAGSLGVGAVIPVVPHTLDVNLSGLYGDGVGRYGDTGLADATYASNGELHPLTGGSMLGGITWHVQPTLDIYADVGEDFVRGYTNTVGGTTYGYGNNAVVNNNQSLTPGTGYLNTGIGGTYSPYDIKDSIQETIGLWWAVYKGSYGAAKLGLQYTHATLDAFNVAAGTYGAFSPSTSDNMIETSLRFYPF